MGKVSDFLSHYHSESTRQTYASGIKAFLFLMYPEKKGEGYEALADRYFSDNRNYPEDVIQYAATFSKAPAKTARTRISSVKEFLVFYDIEIREKDIRTIRRSIPKGGASTVEADLDAKILLSIIQHCSLWLRALILLMASSGLRIGEARNLDMSDIDLKNDIGVISVRDAKGGMGRYTFCSIEAADTIREWLKKRQDYLKSAQNRGRGLKVKKDQEDTRLFPMSKNNISEAWENAIINTGLHSRDRITKRLQIHPHMLRKFFSSQLSIAVPRDIVEHLMGHSGYLSDAYRRYTRKQVEEFYRKGEAYVTVNMTDEIRELRTTTDQKMKAHSDILESLVQRNIKAERQLQELQDLTENLQQYIQREREQSE